MAYPTFFFKWRHVYKQNFRFFYSNSGLHYSSSRNEKKTIHKYTDSEEMVMLILLQDVVHIHCPVARINSLTTLL